MLEIKLIAEKAPVLDLLYSDYARIASISTSFGEQ
jgi:hypothetical protein